MHLLITTFTYLPNKDGVSEAVRTMAEGLSSLGHSVVVATSAAQGSPLKEHINGVRVVRFLLQNNIPFAQQSITEQARFTDLLIKEDADLLINHCWDAWPALLAYPIFSKLRAKKVQVSHGFSKQIWEFNPQPFWGIGQWIRGLLWTAFTFPKMLYSYDAIVFLEEMKGLGRFFDHTLACCLKHPMIQYIPNSTDPSKMPPFGTEFRTRHAISHGPMVLCIANYSERKNQELAVRAFRLAGIPGATLVFIGSEFNSYSNHVRRLNAALESSCPGSNIIFLEKISRQETLEAYIASDIFLLTAKAETQPIVLIEAMAAGKPWISTPTGCVSLMEGGVAVKGVRKLAISIQDISRFPAFAKSLSDQGKRAVEEKYCATKIIDKWNNFFLRINSVSFHQCY